MNPTEIFKSLHPSRLAHYRSLSGGQDADALALYEWNIEVAAALQDPLGIAEVAVRHAIDTQLCGWSQQHVGAPEWIDHRAGIPYYEMVRGRTMISQAEFVSNLRLAQRVTEVPGVILEAGTWRAGMIAGIAKLLGNGREYWLCDSFEGMPPAEEIDGYCTLDNLHALEWEKHHNNLAADYDAKESMSLVGIDNYQLVKGWFEDTLPGLDFSEGIALLRLDADWHSSTTTILENLFPKVNEGGMIIVDDYYAWDGCARAVHEYLAREGRTERITTEGAWWLGAGVCFMVKKAG